MKEKRGNRNKAQVSVFVILAVVIVAAGFLAYFVNKNLSQSNADKEFFESAAIKPQFENIKTSIDDCMKFTSNDALDLIGIQGGYYKNPKEYFDLGWAFIPYYYKEGLFLMPEKNTIEKELGLYVDENLGDCFKEIKVGDFIFDYKKPKTKATIIKGQVSFLIDMPLSIKKEDKSFRLQLKENPIVQNSKLYEILEVAKYITDSHREDPEMICINCIADMAKERGVFVDMLNFNDDTTQILISENQTSLGFYSFEFLNKYKKK